MANNNPQNDPQPIQGHQYDGIEEYDNPMPGWWIWIFILSCVFAVLYVIGINTGYVNTYTDDLDENLANLEQIRAEYAAAQPAFVVDEATLSGFISDPEKVAAGKVNFDAQCAACHGPQGQGLIGPNLTDQYWVLGGQSTDIYTVISKGSLQKGMPPWEGMYTEEQRAELVAYVLSLEGTDPPNPKDPEGELVERG